MQYSFYRQLDRGPLHKLDIYRQYTVAIWCERDDISIRTSFDKPCGCDDRQFADSCSGACAVLTIGPPIEAASALGLLEHLFQTDPGPLKTDVAHL